MEEAEGTVSPEAWARIAGLSLLAIIIFGFAGMYLTAVGGTGSEVVGILAQERRYRLGVVCEFLMLNNDALLAVALYGLLKRVDGPLALLGTFWRFGNVALLGVGVAASLAALGLLHTPEAAAPLLRLDDNTSQVGLLFWSLGAGIHSWVLWKSRYIPQVLSLAYLAITVVIFVAGVAMMILPEMGAHFLWIVLPDLPVELAVALWLTVKGAAIQPAAVRL